MTYYFSSGFKILKICKAIVEIDNLNLRGDKAGEREGVSKVTWNSDHSKKTWFTNQK